MTFSAIAQRPNTGSQGQNRYQCRLIDTLIRKQQSVAFRVSAFWYGQMAVWSSDPVMTPGIGLAP
jgi:hypothetical protein